MLGHADTAVVLLSLASVVSVSMISLVGLLALSRDEARVRRAAEPLVGFAAGALLGDAFIHLIPETFASTAEHGTTLGNSLLILLGVLVFFTVEKLVRHRHRLLHAHAPPHVRRPDRPELAAVNVFGDAIHNLIDGILIGASYLASPTLGLSTTVAVVLHEIPQELADFGILVHSGLSPRRAVLVNLASASVAILGTGLALLAGSFAREWVPAHLLPVTAGGFVYLAAADLIPELQQERGFRSLLVQTGLITLGIAVMGLLATIA